MFLQGPIEQTSKVLQITCLFRWSISSIFRYRIIRIPHQRIINQRVCSKQIVWYNYYIYMVFMLCFEPVLFHCNVLYKKFIFVVRYERNQFGMIMTFGFDSFGMYYSNLSCLLNSRTAIILFLRMSTSIKRLDIMVYVFEYLKIHISAKISITISLMRTYLDIDIGIGDSKY